MREDCEPVVSPGFYAWDALSEPSDSETRDLNELLRRACKRGVSALSVPQSTGRWAGGEQIFDVNDMLQDMGTGDTAEGIFKEGADYVIGNLSSRELDEQCRKNVFTNFCFNTGLPFLEEDSTSSLAGVKDLNFTASNDCCLHGEGKERRRNLDETRDDSKLMSSSLTFIDPRALLLSTEPLAHDLFGKLSGLMRSSLVRTVVLEGSADSLREIDVSRSNAVTYSGSSTQDGTLDAEDAGAQPGSENSDSRQGSSRLDLTPKSNGHHLAGRGSDSSTSRDSSRLPGHLKACDFPQKTHETNEDILRICVDDSISKRQELADSMAAWEAGLVLRSEPHQTLRTVLRQNKTHGVTGSASWCATSSRSDMSLILSTLSRSITGTSAHSNYLSLLVSRPQIVAALLKSDVRRMGIPANCQDIYSTHSAYMPSEPKEEAAKTESSSLPNESLTNKQSSPDESLSEKMENKTPGNEGKTTAPDNRIDEMQNPGTKVSQKLEEEGGTSVTYKQVRTDSSRISDDMFDAGSGGDIHRNVTDAIIIAECQGDTAKDISPVRSRSLGERDSTAQREGCALWEGTGREDKEEAHGVSIRQVTSEDIAQESFVQIPSAASIDTHKQFPPEMCTLPEEGVACGRSQDCLGSAHSVDSRGAEQQRRVAGPVEVCIRRHVAQYIAVDNARDKHGGANDEDEDGEDEGVSEEDARC